MLTYFQALYKNWKNILFVWTMCLVILIFLQVKLLNKPVEMACIHSFLISSLICL